MKRRFALAWLVLTLFYAAAPVRVQTDSIWVIPTARSLADDFDTNLSEYGAATTTEPHGLTTAPNGAVHSTFPLGPALVAAPVVWLTTLAARALSHLPSPLHRPFIRWLEAIAQRDGIKHGFFDTTEVLIASGVVALGVLAFFVVARRFASERAALSVTAVLALGSPALSTWTRALWSHGPAFTSLALALALFVTGRNKILVGALTVFAVICRPTALLAAAVLGVVVLATSLRARNWRDAALVKAGALLIGVPWLAWSAHVFGSVVPPYYEPARLDAQFSTIASALAGQLVSPSRGLILYVPFVVLAFVLPLIRSRAKPLHVAAALLGLVHVFVIARFPHWWGGHCYGPRLSSDAVPMFLLAALPATDALLEKRPGRVVITALAAWCLATNLPGAFRWQTWDWSGQPADVDTAPDRLWDFSDPQFLR